MWPFSNKSETPFEPEASPVPGILTEAEREREFGDAAWAARSRRDAALYLKPDEQMLATVGADKWKAMKKSEAERLSDAEKIARKDLPAVHEVERQEKEAALDSLMDTINGIEKEGE